MRYIDSFNITDAHIIGKSHQRLLYNNQDAFSWGSNASLTVGVVCDGCGSRPNSEVGAKLGARFITNYLLKNASNPSFEISQLQTALEAFMLRIAQQLADDSQDDWKEVLRDYFLFTIVGFVANSAGVTFFSMGDGVILHDTTWVDLSTNNKPNYLCYNLLKSQLGLQFKTFYQANPIQRILIATDGLQDILESLTAKKAFENCLSRKDLFDSPIVFNQLLMTDFLEWIYDDTTLIFMQQK